MITKNQIREILSLNHDTYLMNCADSFDTFPEEMEKHKLGPDFFADWVVNYIYSHLKNNKNE